MNKKKGLLKAFVFLMYLIITVVTFITWQNKSKIHDDFLEMRIEINQKIRADQKSGNEFLYAYCDTVKQYIDINPIEVGYTLNCKIFSNQVDSLKTEEFKAVFLEQTKDISKEYRRQKMEAHWISFVSQFLALMLFWPLWFFIDKRFAEKKIE